jgi:hypothetical protein
MLEIIENIRTEISTLTKDEIREKIRKIHTAMDSAVESGGLVKSSWDTTHRFSKGAYCREFFVKAGTIIVGKLHHAEHFLSLLRVKLRFYQKMELRL